MSGRKEKLARRVRKTVLAGLRAGLTPEQILAVAQRREAARKENKS